jgi:hypothetical protein
MPTTGNQVIPNLFPNRRSLLRNFNNLPAEIQPHFEHFSALIQSEFPLEVCLAYLFFRVELAHRDTLYCGVVKLHHADASMARRIIQNQHLTRDDFRTLFESLFGAPLKPSVAAKIKNAESIRDKAMHGSEPTEAMMRMAISGVLDYAKEYNDFVKSLAGFPPFGDLRGFHGRGGRLSPATTRLVLKGLGFKLA